VAFCARWPGSQGFGYTAKRTLAVAARRASGEPFLIKELAFLQYSMAVTHEKFAE
jgi:hypothetical protein